MPGSQLKRLKASLREQGVIGPQQSKKQKRRNAQDGKAAGGKRLQKAAALDSIREQFNPFDFKHNARGPKFEVTSNRPATGNAAKGISGRPSDAKAAGEERRRQTLLVEMNRRNKTGGILDRRFGEHDPTMSLEEKMQQRFVREKQSHKTNSLFDLEEDEPLGDLTHFGKSLFDGPLAGPQADDFNEKDLVDSDADVSGDDLRTLKRLRAEDTDGADEGQLEGQPDRKKTKQEVYKEIMAKSKLHKAERQAQKDADEDLRDELDHDFQDIHALLLARSNGKGDTDDGTPQPAPTGRDKMERDYDLRLRQLALDRKAQASERTKTDEERAQEDVKKLRDLEERKLKRMRGEEASDSEASKEDGDESEDDPADKLPMFTEPDESDAFGLGAGIKRRPTAAELGLDDEDDFVVEDDLLASGSDLEPIESEESEDDDDSNADEEEDDEFTKGLLNEYEAQNPAFREQLGAGDHSSGHSYACPRSLTELLEITNTLPVEEISTAIQKIRILHHPKSASENKSKLSSFASILPQFLRHLSNLSNPPFAAMEAVIRHIHSMAKTYPIEVANEFRSQINEYSSRPLAPEFADLIMLWAIGTIFPPSDHFHQVTSPAMLVIARYLGQKVPRQVRDYSEGTFMCTLALQYQKLSKRWIPEVMNFCLNTLVSLAPTRTDKQLGNFPRHEPSPGTRIKNASHVSVRKMGLLDCIENEHLINEEAASAKVAVVDTTLQLLETAADMYSGKSSFIESFEPVVHVLAQLSTKPCKAMLPIALNEHVVKLQTRLRTMLSIAKVARRPLELHHHRPLAIKAAIPKFEEKYAPDKHYDNNKDRADLAKLKAEHKKERKGAMRELRKDANFVARERLRVKKEKDAAYEKKYKRLVAEIQGEEGREANLYERERQMRKRAAKR
ncbi:Nop14-like protein [Xylariaceae sp. FL0804]|nr:Nop14-like protein [Xylariaceae sp. FL0804]